MRKRRTLVVRASSVGLGAVLALAGCGLDAIVLHEGSGGPRDGGADGSIVLRGDGSVAPTTDAFGVSLGQYFSCAIVSGAAYCWGSNVQGALGTGDLDSHLTPTPVTGGHLFDALSGGENHACGIEHETRRVFCWGYGGHGQLGQGDTANHSSPVPVALAAGAEQLSAGYNHTCAVLVDGSLECWGANDEGQLGQDDSVTAISLLTPTRVGTSADWKEVSGGQAHTCALKKNGALYCWGRNTASDLGLGAGQGGQLRGPRQVGTSTDWATIDVGQDEGCAVKTDGSLHCWGGGSGPNLDGSGATLNVPTRIGAANDWSAISVDVFSTCGLSTSHVLRCWGRNAEGQLGLGDFADRPTPTEVGANLSLSWLTVSVGRFHVCAGASDHTVHCAGADDSGQLGLGDTDRRNATTLVPFPAAPPPP